MLPKLVSGEWTGSGDRRSEVKGEVPASLRGKLARLDLEAASAEVEALTLRLRFFEGESMIAEYLLKPYLYPGGGKEFFAFTIPAMAASFTAQARLSKKSGTVRITGGQLLVEDTGD